MKRMTTVLVTILMVVALLVGCSSASADDEDSTGNPRTVEVQYRVTSENDSSDPMDIEWYRPGETINEDEQPIPWESESFSVTIDEVGFYASVRAYIGQETEKVTAEILVDGEVIESESITGGGSQVRATYNISTITPGI